MQRLCLIMPKIIIDRSLSFIEGTQRVLDEKSTLEKTKPNLDKIGVTRIASITDLDRMGIPVFLSLFPFAQSVKMYWVSSTGRINFKAVRFLAGMLWATM